MMPLTRTSRSITVFLIFVMIFLPLAAGVYFSDPESSAVFRGVRDRKANLNYTRKSNVLGEKIYLVKDKSLIINRCKLTYKGIQNGLIHIDLYLLDLDPQSPYPQAIPKADAKEGIFLGNTRFSLVSAYQYQLTLKILENRVLD